MSAKTKNDMLECDLGNDDDDSRIRTTLRCGSDWHTIIIVRQEQLSV